MSRISTKTSNYGRSLSPLERRWFRQDRLGAPRRHRYLHASRPHDINGINGEHFHPYLVKEGKLRGGLEFLSAKPKLRVPWEEA